MPTFKYIARNTEGAKVSGSLEAETPNDLSKKLIQQGLMPLEIKRLSGATKREKSVWQIEIIPTKVTMQELVVFCRQMYAMLKAGVTLIDALNHVQTTTRSHKLQEVLDDVIEDVSSGKTLSSALRKHPKTFTEIFRSLIEAGESTGQVEEVFKELALHLDFEIKTIRQIKTASRYPILVIIAVFIALLVINFMVIPSFSKMFAQFGADLPLPTRIIVGTSNFMLDNWVMMFFGFLFVMFTSTYFFRTRAGKLWWGKTMFQLPVFGSVFHKIMLGRYTRVFSLLMRSGVEIVQSVKLVASVLGNEYVKERMLAMRANLERGEKFSLAAKQSGVFDNLILQMIAVGEQTGDMGELLSQISIFYEDEIEYEIGRIKELMEPIILIFMAVLVVILAMGVFLPIWNMAQIVS